MAAGGSTNGGRKGRAFRSERVSRIHPSFHPTNVFLSGALESKTAHCRACGHISVGGGPAYPPAAQGTRLAGRGLGPCAAPMSVQCFRAAWRYECMRMRPINSSSSTAGTAARLLSWRPRRHMLLPTGARRRVDWLVARAGSGRSINWVRECDGTYDEDEGDEEDAEALSESSSSSSNGTQPSLAAAASVNDPDADRLDAQVEALQSQLDALREVTLAGADSSDEATVLDLEEYTDTYSIDDVQELKAQIDNLKAVVFKQRELIRNLQSAANARIPPGTAIIAGANGSSSSSPPSPSPSPSAGLISPFDSWEGPGPRAASPAISDRRHLGGFDARFHSTSAGATPKDFRVLPARIILVRHGQSYEDGDQFEYSSIPDPRIPLTDVGREQVCGGSRHETPLSHLSYPLLPPLLSPSSLSPLLPLLLPPQPTSPLSFTRPVFFSPLLSSPLLSSPPPSLSSLPFPPLSFFILPPLHYPSTASASSSSPPLSSPRLCLPIKHPYHPLSP